MSDIDVERPITGRNGLQLIDVPAGWAADQRSPNEGALGHVSLSPGVYSLLHYITVF